MKKNLNFIHITWRGVSFTVKEISFGVDITYLIIWTDVFFMVKLVSVALVTWTDVFFSSSKIKANYWVWFNILVFLTNLLPYTKKYEVMDVDVWINKLILFKSNLNEIIYIWLQVSFFSWRGVSTIHLSKCLREKFPNTMRPNFILMWKYTGLWCTK